VCSVNCRRTTRFRIRWVARDVQTKTDIMSSPFFRIYLLYLHASSSNWLNLCQKRIDANKSDGELLEIPMNRRSLLSALHPRSRFFLVFIVRFLPLLMLPAPHLLFNVDIMQGGLLALIQLHVRQLAPWLWWKDLLK